MVNGSWASPGQGRARRASAASEDRDDERDDRADHSPDPEPLHDAPRDRRGELGSRELRDPGRSPVRRGRLGGGRRFAVRVDELLATRRAQASTTGQGEPRVAPTAPRAGFGRRHHLSLLAHFGKRLPQNVKERAGPFQAPAPIAEVEGLEVVAPPASSTVTAPWNTATRPYIHALLYGRAFEQCSHPCLERSLVHRVATRSFGVRATIANAAKRFQAGPGPVHPHHAVHDGYESHVAASASSQRTLTSREQSARQRARAEEIATAAPLQVSTVQCADAHES